MKSAARVVIFGARGRMGQALIQSAASLAEVTVVGQVDLGDSLADVVDAADVVIEFSAHTATAGCLELCVAKSKAMVIGTTGHTESEKGLIRSASVRIPVVYSANYSTGVNVLFWLTKKAAEVLGSGFDVEVVEMHHRMKRDAPSGTAARLVEILAEARGVAAGEAVRHGRSGMPGERTSSEIGVHAIRGGDVVGDHTVMFAAAGERVELAHKATSRETLARGALRAAGWVRSRPPGLYDMQDVLGLK